MAAKKNLCLIVKELLTQPKTELFTRPACSTRLIDAFEKRIKQSEMENNTDWINDFILLRTLIDNNQNILKKMNRLRPPKSERTVMEAISRRVGLEMPHPNHSSVNEELKYLFEKFYVPLDELNKPPKEEND